VALTFAARYPRHVSKLVLEGPVGGYHTVWNPLGWLDQMVFSLLPLLLQASIKLFGYHATSQWLNLFGVKAKRNLLVLEKLQHKTDYKAIRQLLWDSALTPYTGQLQNVSAPVLLIRGCNDPMPKRFVDYIRTHLPQVTYVEVADARHLVALEKFSEFNQMVIGFLELTPTATPTL